MALTFEYLEELQKKKKKNLGDNLKSNTSNTSEGLTYEYLESIQQKREENMQDIAPVRTTTSTKDDGGLDFFQQGVFENGYDFGDITKSILGTTADFGLNALAGVGNLAEGVGDAINYGIADVSDFFGADSFANSLREETKKNLVNQLLGDTIDTVDKWSVLGKTSDAVAQGLGMMTGIVATGGALGGLGLSAGAVSGATTGLMGLSGFGSGMSQAYEGGATDKEARLYGVIAGASDALSELMFGGMGKSIKALGFSRGLSSADDMLAKKVSSMFSNQIMKNISEFGIKAGAEGLEEWVAGLAQGIGKKITYMSEEDIGKILADENLLEQFVVGSVTSGLMQSGGLRVANKTNTDFITGLNENEQKVVDKEVENRIAEKEQDGKKLSKKEKDKIYDEVITDLDKGAISIDTIESVLGGEEYTSYQDATKKKSELQKEYDELYQMKNGDKSDAQIDRQSELKQQLEELKNNSITKEQLYNNVYNVAKDSRLVESYNEKARRGQLFEADLSKYNENEKAVVQKAIDSGVLNNTNRTHDFVDLIAKISAEKGVSFDFTNNEKLKESGFAFEDKTIDGFVNGNDILLNIDSPKAHKTVVGHEITHILEGTELYAELEEVVKQYATTKGEYAERMQTLRDKYTGIYEGKDFDEKIRRELTADIVGEYLFSDEKFIHNLSTEQPSLFKKIYDEIKYLCKIATSGSKEAREFEKLKRTFERIYKETGSVNKTTETKYSVSEENKGKTLYTGSPNTNIQQFKVGGVENSKQSGDRYGRGVYLTTNENTAKGYAGDNGRVYNVNADDLNVFNLNDAITDDMKKSLLDELNNADKQYRNSILRNFRTEKTFTDFESAKAFMKEQRAIWNEQDGYYEANKPKTKTVNRDTRTTVIEYTDFNELENSISKLTGNQLYDALKSISTDDFSSFIMANGYDGITFNEDADNQQYVIYKNEDKLHIENPDIKYSVSDDGYYRANELQTELNQVRNSIKEIESSDEFKTVVNNLTKAINNDDAENGTKAYMQWKEESGYKSLLEKKNTLQTELDSLKKKISEESKSKALEEERNAIAKSGLSEADYFRKQAVKEFGYTPYFYDAGYITPNGKMLNFSGEKGKHYGSRGQDHRAIGIVYAETSGTDALNRFIKDGNVRIMAESPGIDISTVAEPTKEQYSTIRKFVYEYGDKESFFNVDFTDESGNVIGSLTYENNVNATRILNDIKHFYATGEIRQQSNVDKFRYSLSENIENSENILYNSDSPLSIVNRATSNNNSSINWVYKAEIFSVAENKQFHQKISEINQGSEAFEKNDSGEYMLPIGNKIVFTDGNYDSPYIREIVEVLTEHQTEFEDIKESIYAVEKGKSEKYDATRYVQNTYGEGCVISYKSRNNGVYEWQNGKRKGKTRRTVIRNYLNKQYGTRNDKQSTEFEAGLNESAFSNAQNDEYSLSNEGDVAPVKRGNAPLKDFAYQPTEVAPVVAENTTTTEDVAPVTEEFDDISEESSNRLNSLTEDDVPPIKEAPYYEDDAIQLTPTKVDAIARSVYELVFPKYGEKKTLKDVIQRYASSKISDRYALFDEIKKVYGEKTITEEDVDLLEVQNTLRAYPLKITDDIKAEYPEYSDFMRSHRGKLRFSKEGEMVDQAYQELSNLYPGYFPDTIWNSADQFRRIVEVSEMDRFATDTFELLDEDIQKATDIIANEVDKYKAEVISNEETALIRDAQVQNREWLDEVAPTKATQITETAPTVTENKPIKTVKERLAEKLKGVETEIADNKQLQKESVADFNVQISKLQEEYANKKNKNTKVANDILRKIERLQRIRDSVSADYSKRISDLETKRTKISDEYNSGESTTEQGAMRRELHQSIIDNIKSRFAEKGFDFEDVLKKAKNLSTFRTVDNIPQRVMEKALGYKEGQILADETVNKVAQNETEGIKWLNSFTGKDGILRQLSKEYNIKPGSKKSAVAQMYAEGFYVNENNEIIQYGNAELEKDFPDAQDRADIIGLASDPRIRQIYDDTLSEINASRSRNAYPEIKALDNYFLHFRAMDDTFSRLGLPFNPNDIRAKDLPTDLNGVTADLKPGQPYFASAKHRTGMRTSFDLLGGLERYLSSAKNQIYHIDDIQTLRALRNYVADTYGQAKGLESLDNLTEEEAQERIKQVYGSHLSTFANFLNEEANVIAGKTALIDRGLEGIIGRRGITFLNTVNRQVGSNMVGFNVSSSLTNILPVVQTFAKTNKADFVKAIAQTTSNKLNSLKGKGDDFAENSPVIIRRKGADSFYRTPFQKVGDTGYILMSAVDDISTEIIARTKYNELTRKGMDSQQAHFETDKWVSRLMGDRSLGQQPQIFNSKTLGLVTKFQLEVRNQLDSMFYDTVQEAKVSNEEIENALTRNAKTSAKVVSTLFQLAVAQHLFGKAFESVAGYNPTFDIIEALMKTFGLDDDEDDEDTVLDNIEEGFLTLLEDLPYTSTFTGGRIPISSALPIKEVITGKDEYGNDASRWDTIKGAVPYYLLPTGYGQIKKTKKGLSMFDDDLPIAGSYTDSGNLRFPVEDTLGNRVQAGLFGQWANGNAKAYIENEIAPLKENQIQEYIDVDLPIKDYWQYREGLKGLETLNEKGDYIGELDLPIAKKNILINNIADRDTPIDYSDYDKYKNFEEFDFATRYPDKYKVLQEQGISVKDYKENYEDKAFIYTDDYSWASQNAEKYTLSKAVTNDLSAYKQYTSDLSEIRADKDANGKSISGSAKAKKEEYIFGLDIDYGAKCILFRSQYKSDDSYNYDIIEYLNERDDITFAEMKTILKELDIEMDDNGNVYW